MRNNLQQVTMKPDADPAQIADMIRAQGIALFPGYFSAETVEKLNEEFDRFLNEAEARHDTALIKNDGGVVLPVVRNKMDIEHFPVTFEVFGQKMMSEVAMDYLGTPDIALNHQIYVNYFHGVAKPIQKLPFLAHFDKISTFKFFVYLTDTTEENGAMGIDPGSNIENCQIREKALAREGHTTLIPNVKENIQLTPVEGPAGTLFIFDTDASHGVGFVQEGHQRRIMRGHTRTIANLKLHGLQHQAI